MTIDPVSGRWPTFLVIGAARSGTTALHGFLRQHPQVFVPRNKEPGFFALRAMGIDLDSMEPVARVKWGAAVSDAAAYRRMFIGPFDPEGPYPDIRAWGECSPVYMPVGGVAETVRSCVPDMRLIAILRDPVDRAISHHAHNRSMGLEPEPDFESACIADSRKGAHAEYVRQGRYASLLEPFLAEFGREPILLLDHAELSSAPEMALRKIFAHIGVDPGFRPAVGGRVMATTPDEVDGEVRSRLASGYRDDTARLIERYGFDAARVWSSAARL